MSEIQIKLHIIVCNSLHFLAGDYVTVEAELTFESGSPLGSTVCVDITITDDDITEPEESFTVTLTAVSDFVTLGDSTVSTVVIDDSDCKSKILHFPNSL